MLRAEARAKINLTLDVVGKRPDGYHELRTIMHEIPLADELEFDFEVSGLSCSASLPYIKNESNIALKAARLFYGRTGISEGLHLHIKKHVPVGAGLGGGSADAAAVLKVLSERHGHPLPDAELMKMAAALGADVPFCLAGGCALCEGIGERMTPLPTLPKCHIVLVKPVASLSTAEMFAALDRQSKGVLHPDTDGFTAALCAGDLAGLCKRMYNSMEFAAGRCTAISEVKTELLQAGALGACMSGSGSSVFGIFSGRSDAEHAAELCRGHRRSVFLLDM